MIDQAALRSKKGAWAAALICAVSTAVGFCVAADGSDKTTGETRSGGELLVNGIRLPEVWPPTTMRSSDEPMPVPYLGDPPAVIPISVGRQLFVDDFLIENTSLKRTFHRAEKYSGNPVLKPETPVELAGEDDGEESGIQKACCYLGHGGVFYDPAVPSFRMWYNAGWRGGLALATSENGLDWRRRQYPERNDNLLLTRDESKGNKSVWLDLQAENPGQRIKLLQQGNPHSLRTSPDGLEWSEKVTVGKAGDYNAFFYNPFRDVWVFSLKRENTRGRVRYYSESEEFLAADFADAVYWFNADALDEPLPEVGDPAQLYTHTAVAYESLMLGEFLIHLGPHNKICAAGGFPKHTEIKLGFSRDGFHWSRPDRRAFIGPTRRKGDWDRGYVHGNTGVCLVVGDKLYFPYTGFSGVAPDGSEALYSGASIGIATLRRDGFASMDAGGSGGSLETRPVTFDGRYCFVNVDCPEGELRVEVLDEEGAVMAPYSFANCEPISVDSTIQRVEWRGVEDLERLSGRVVRFRFQLKNGRLYSFWVSPDQSGASYGYVAAGGPGFPGTIDDQGLAAYERAEEVAAETN